MIVICDKAQDVIIPAGLGDNPGVVYEKSGVESLNGQQGDLTLKTVNGNELLGEGDVTIDTGVESLNGQKGALTLKTVNGNELTGEGNIEIQAGVESVNGQTGALKLKTIDNKDVLGEGNMDILSDYNICMFMMYNLTLSEADKGVDLYKYGIGDDAANLDKYFSGFKTIQFLNFNIKDGASYKVPVTIFWDGDGNRQFRFVCEGYEYTYTSIDANYCDFTSKVKVGGESGLKYFELTADKAKEAYDEVINHWDSLSGYTGDYVFTYCDKKEKGKKANYYFVKITHIDDETGNYVLFSCVDTDAAFNYRDSTIKIFSVIVYKNNTGIKYNLRTYYNSFPIPTKTSQLTNDSEFQTKSQVDTAIENAISGVSGDQNVIVLDGLTQEERKAVYDKLDKTKAPDVVFVYNNSTSIRTAWDGRDIYFYCITEEENGIRYQAYYFSSDGTIGGQAIIPKFTNSLIIQVNEHINESDNFNCSYRGSFQNYLVEPFTRPNAYFILFKKGYGANTKSVYAPFTAVWDKDFEDNNYQATPVTIQFTIDGITYKYRNDLTNQNTWQYDGKISMYDSHSINGYNGTSLVLGGAALDATDKNKYVAIRSMMGYDTVFNGDNDGSCPYLTITTTDSQMYKVPVVVKCNKQNDSTTRATFEFDLNGYHYLYTQDNQGDLTFSFTSKTQIANINSDEVSNIKVLTQSEYDALEPKDPNTMYCIKGQ